MSFLLNESAPRNDKIFYRFVRLQSRIKKAVETLEFFTSTQWEFTNDNVYKLHNEMNEVDSKVSHFTF